MGMDNNSNVLLAYRVFVKSMCGVFHPDLGLKAYNYEIASAVSNKSTCPIFIKV